MSGQSGYGRILMNEKYLRIYLQDHLAGSTAGLELARRTRGANEGTEYGPPLARIADEIEADRRMLQGIMDDLGFGGDRLKNAGAWALEKAGRLKLNGELTGYSALSRVVELEGLLTGITGKWGLWVALLELAPSEPRLDTERLERLRDRAEEQRATVEELREKAAREAFAAPQTYRGLTPLGWSRCPGSPSSRSCAGARSWPGGWVARSGLSGSTRRAA